MKAMVVSHTYITTLNRDKWKVFAAQHPDITVTLIFPERWPAAIFTHKASIDANEQTKNYIPVAIPTRREGNELLYTYHHKPLFELMKSTRPDLIYVEQGINALSYAQINLYAKLLGLKTKNIFFTWVNWHQKLSLKSKIFLAIIERFNRSCSSGAIAGNNDAQKILQQNGFKQPIIVLPQLGVNQYLFKPVVLTHHEKKYIGYIGRITEEKGVFFLVRAFLALADIFPDWSLVFVGKGDGLLRLRSFVASKRMLHRIEFCDPVPHDKIATMLQKMNFLVLPSYDTSSWREQFGHVIIEAMACNVPVLGSNAGEIPHVIGNAGLIFEQRNELALREQLQKLMIDDALRKSLGNLGYARVHEHYTHEIIATKTYAFWQQIST